MDCDIVRRLNHGLTIQESDSLFPNGLELTNGLFDTRLLGRGQAFRRTETQAVVDGGQQS